MDADLLQRVLDLDAEGKSARQIALEPGMPSHVTITKILKRRAEKELERQGVNTPTYEAVNRAGVKTVNPVIPKSVMREKLRPENNPVVRLAQTRSLVGMHLSPKELLDAKEAGVLPPTAWLSGGGKVFIAEEGAEPLWPVFIMDEKGVYHPEPPRPAHRTAEGPRG